MEETEVVKKRGRPRKDSFVEDKEVSPEVVHKMNIIRQDEQARKSLKVVSQRYVITSKKVFKYFIKSNGNEYSTFICNNNPKYSKIIDDIKSQSKIPVEIK